jgi:hypothetical protein
MRWPEKQQKIFGLEKLKASQIIDFGNGLLFFLIFILS